MTNVLQTTVMKWSRTGLMIGLVVFTLVFVACAGAKQSENETGETDASIAGTYTCAPEPTPDDPNWPGPEDFELNENGDLTIGRGGKVNLEGTWSVQKDQVVLHIKGQGDDRFDVEGDRLVAAGGPPPQGGGQFICMRKAD